MLYNTFCTLCLTLIHLKNYLLFKCYNDIFAEIILGRSPSPLPLNFLRLRINDFQTFCSINLIILLNDNFFFLVFWQLTWPVWPLHFPVRKFCRARNSIFLRYHKSLKTTQKVKETFWPPEFELLKTKTNHSVWLKCQKVYHPSH